MDALPRHGDVVAVAPDRTRPPSKALWAAEIPRAAWTVLRLAATPRTTNDTVPGRGRPVMLLPGLFNSDRSNIALRLRLNGLGYCATGWGLGRNFGERTIGREASRLIAAIDALAADAAAPVALVGVSLGGIMARYVARRRPDLVGAVVTISSPFAGDPRATNVWRAFEWVTRERIDDPRLVALWGEAARPLAMPSLAIWSASDGLVNGHNCRGEGDPLARDLRIASGHLAVQLNPDVLRAVADFLGGSGAQRSP